MHNITCFDEYGNVVYGFTQWDLNQKIYIEDLDFATTPSFHFQNKNTTRALVVSGVSGSNGMISVDVPNQLLVEPYPISIYVYMIDGSAAKVMDNIQLPIRPRQQPHDFVMKDNIDLIALEDVKRKLEELKANLNELGYHADNIPYDNTESNLQGDTVGDAIDELAYGLIFIDEEDDGGETPDTPTDAEKVADAKSVIEEAISSMSVTNDTTQSDIQTVVNNALANEGITDVTATVGSINKSNATTSSSGVITGSVSITSGTASDSVAISKTIAQLPESDADKVSNAKEIIEAAINSMTVTNDTTQSTIQTVVDNALTNAGINDVTATVQNVNVTVATSSTTGTVTGNVAITSGSASDSVNIHKTIAQLESDGETKDGVTNTLDDITLYEPIYLYNYGVTADEFGGWNASKRFYDYDGVTYEDTGNLISVTENSDHIYFNIPAYNDYYGVMSISAANTFNWEDIAEPIYNYKINAKYEIVNTTYDEGDLVRFASVAFSNSSGSGGTQLLLADIVSNENNIVTTKSGSTYDGMFDNTENSFVFSFNKRSDTHDVDSAYTFKLYQLYLTPDGTDKFVDAWNVIEEAINNMSVTNETTIGNIQSVVNSALSSASLSSYVTATVGSSSFEKILATTTKEGSIAGKITITSLPENHQMEFTKIIAKLPENSADSETEDITTPDGTSPFYLYNRGVMSDVLDGFTAEGTTTVSEESDHIAITCPQGEPLTTVTSNYFMDLSTYDTLYLEYEYVNGSTGETLSSAGQVYYMRTINEDGGNNVLLTLANTSVSLSTLDTAQQIQFAPASNTIVMSADYDVILKIYSLRIE